jgi:CRISPR system Cascade subunit CasE
MHAIHDAPSADRAESRRRAIEAAGTAWLAKQAEKGGFSVAGAAPLPADSEADDAATTRSCAVAVTGYRTLRLPRAGAAATIGVLDFEGTLEVREPELFLTALGNGFGRAKAFGCGLMLIRRA